MIGGILFLILAGGVCYLMFPKFADFVDATIAKIKEKLGG